MTASATRIKRVLAFAAVLSSVPVAAHALARIPDTPPTGYTEEWHALKSGVPWIDPQALGAWEKRVYVSATGSTDGARLWSSLDGVAWRAETPPALVGAVIQHFVSAPAGLFAFAATEPLGPSSQRRIFFAADGVHWSRVDGGAVPDGLWSDAAVFNNRLYAAGQEGSIWVGDEHGWQTSAWNPADGRVGLNFAVYQGALYLEHEDPFEPDLLELSRTSDGSVWENDLATGTFRCELSTWPCFGVFSAGGRIFISGGSIVATPGAGGFTDNWTGMNTAAYQMRMPFYFPALGRVEMVNIADGWTGSYRPDQLTAPLVPTKGGPISITSTITPRFHQSATVGASTFVLVGDVWVLKQGLASVERTPFSTSGLLRGQRDRVVLAFAAHVNVSDVVRKWVVTNLGTAEAGLDIERVRLFQATSDPGSDLFGYDLTTLVPSADRRTWTTPSGFSKSLTDVTQLFLAVDVSRDARDGRTCQFQLEQDGALWDTGPDAFAPSPTIAAEKSQTINGVASAPELIDGVVVYPSPAQNQVHFLYDLPAAADVRVEIFGRDGSLVARVDDPNKPPDPHASTVWDASRAGNGLYYATIRIQGAAGERRYKRNVYVER